MDDIPKPFAQFGVNLVTEAKRIEEDATYSAKGHFEASRLWGIAHFLVGIPTSVLAAIAGVTALKDHKEASVILSMLVAASSAVFTFLNPDSRAARHMRAGNAYKELQNNARVFYEIQCQQGRRPAELNAALHELNTVRNRLNNESPQIPRLAFTLARKGIEQGEAAYRVDENR